MTFVYQRQLNKFNPRFEIAKTLTKFAVIVLVVTSVVVHTYATNLTEIALFQRCYLQITSQQVSTTDSLYTQVKSGTLTAVNACNQLLDSAQLSGTSTMTLTNSTDARAQSILATFHRLHSSWFYAKDFPVISWPGHADDMRDLYDSTSPALYFTRALFGAGVTASDPVTSNDFLIAQRSNMNPTAGPESTHPLSDFLFQTTFAFAGIGTLTGVQAVASKMLSFPANPAPNPNRPAGSVDLYGTIGGGFLGTQPYLNLNLGTISSYSQYKTDGTILLHRRWGKAVYHDTLCRDLPVVRESDATQFVDPASTIAFRTTAACAKCHVSHDRVSSVIRHLTILYIGTGDPTAKGVTDRGGNFAVFHPITKPAEASWPTAPDVDYYRRPTNGQLYFRNYDGVLIDQALTSASDLGQKLAQTDDYYICLARRYYNYFLGIDVNTGDLADPASGIKLGANAKIHRDNVVALGKNLKTSQSLSQLIKNILQLKNYRKSDFGATGAELGP